MAKMLGYMRVIVYIKYFWVYAPHRNCQDDIVVKKLQLAKVLVYMRALGNIQHFKVYSRHSE